MAPCWGPHWQPLLAILIAAWLAVGPVGIIAQTSTVVCLSEFGWMDNSRDQNPCLVAAYLQGACNGGQWSVTPLPPDTHYIGPSANESNPCQCSSVTYSTISACGACQNDTYVDWSIWSTNCTSPYLGSFPLSIPDGTAVPQWAFQDVTIGDAFNVSLAQSVGDSPESTAPQSTTASTTTTSTSSAFLTSPPSASTTTSSGGNSNAGAIAGGVVGGVVGVALIAAAAVFFILKKKRPQLRPSAPFGAVVVPTSPSSPSNGFLGSPPLSPEMVQPMLYNPSDPSTFPPSPPPPTFTTGSSHNIQNHLLGYSSASGRPGGYSGAPEV